jgi:HD-GYP domain-containing protein (c-di-GMP phosphodiesterase class II)
MERLACRLRADGFFLVFLGPDGSARYYDQRAGLFFQRFALPAVLNAFAPDAPLRRGADSTGAAEEIALIESLPGLVVAAAALNEKRQPRGTIVLVARAAAFTAGEDVLRICGSLGLDSAWLIQQAQSLPAHSPDALRRYAHLLAAMLQDQLRLGGLERELNELSLELANNYEELSLVYQLSAGMRVNRTFDEFFKKACSDLIDVMGVRGTGVMLSGTTADNGVPTLFGSIHLSPENVQRLAGQLMVTLWRDKKPLVINDLAASPDLGWLCEYGHSLVAVPLQRQEKLLGCMFALDKIDGDFDSRDSKLLNSVANQSAIYLENVTLFDDVRGLMLGLLRSLTSAVDAKDTYTCGHSERVALLARELTRTAGLGEEIAQRVYMAGLLHDVGKIGVPESVLRKAGRLTPEEFDQMKKHPQIGARILQDVKQIQDLIPGVLHHHERYDGQGYPTGAAGEAIPLMGRIICLADCFDAMTSNRTYRKALPPEVALSEIQRCSGTQFDPLLAEAFVRIGVERLRAVLADAGHAGPAMPSTGQAS